MIFLKRLLAGNIDDKSSSAQLRVGQRLNESQTIADRIEVVFEQAETLVSSGHFADAFALIDLERKNDPRSVDLQAVRASTLHFAGRFHEAYQCFKEIDGHLRRTKWMLQYAWCGYAVGDLTIAEMQMRRAISVEPHNHEGYLGLGIALKVQGRADEAAASFSRGIEKYPGQRDCMLHLAGLRLDANDLGEAESLLQQVIVDDDECQDAWTHLGLIAVRRGDHYAASEAFNRASQMERGASGSVDSFVNLGINLRDNGRRRDALDLYERNLLERPNVDGYFGYSIALLLGGQLLSGSYFNEFRWLRQPSLGMRPQFPVPRWDNQSLDGKIILLRAEQGMGDAMQFVRYAPYLQALGATVYLDVFTALRDLMRSARGVNKVIESTHAPAFDYYIHLLSLPRVFGTELETIPAAVPYLHVDGGRVAQWAPRLGSGEGVRVGLVWAGNPAHANDRNRSMRLEQLRSLWEVVGVQFISLQKGLPVEEIQELPKDMNLLELGSAFEDFSDTAAVIEQLDLVLCVDTAVAHLAGALGKPVWVMLATPSDWRWLEGRADTPWYPTMRLFRQSVRGEWDDVIADVKRALEERVRTGYTEPSRPSSVTPTLPQATLPHATPGHRPGFSAVAECRDGILQYLPDQPFEGDSLGWYGEYLQPQITLLSQLIRPGGTAMEAGAGVGAHALFLARAVGDAGHLFLYESRPIVQRILRQNLAANRVVNITLMRRALGGPADPGRSAEGGPPVSETVDELRLERLDYLKVNAGAAALDILEGATETLWRLRPLLFLGAPDEGELMALAERARECSYRCWRLQVPLFNVDNFNRREADIFDGATSLTLLAIPEEVDVDIPLHPCIEIS